MKWHLAWAAMAVVAFVVGKATTSDSEPDRSAESKVDTLRANASRANGIDADGTKLTRNSGSASERSPVIDLFGSLSANGAGLNALAEQAFRDPNPITRRLAFGQLLASLTPENAGEIRDLLVANRAGGDEWRDFHYSWGAISGREAVDFAAKSGEQDMEATMSGWASANPAEALSFLDNLPEDLAGSRTEIAQSIVAGLADRDLGSATDLVMKLAADGVEGADRMIEVVAFEALRSGGPSEAAAWATTLADGSVKGAAMNRIAGAYVREDPQAAAAWIENFAAEDYAARAVAEVGEEWGERDPTSAVSWLETLPAGQGQSSAFREVLGDWEDTDPVAASQYLSNMPPSPQRDAAVSGFARGYAWQDPQAAIAWAQDISDPALRQRSLTEAGQAYYRRDPESARAWLENSGLPPEAQQQVLERRRR
ncbi:hypothetical protein [Haloferula sp.]|uniref:hypothetical protein n=1 Tax=Haloferula sp. TaxID=2497595 RepID=UPI003C790892